MTALSQTRGRIILILLCVVDFMVALDFSIMNVTLPVIKNAFDFSPASLQWVISAYALAFGGLLILGGRAADYYGRRRVLMIGLVIFCVASLAAGLSQNAIMLVLLRGAQGVGAAVIAPSALSLLTGTFVEPRERQRALGAWGAVLGAGFVCGVILGGVITQYLGWRWVLLVNAPVAAALTALCPFTLPEGRAQAARHKLDLTGGLLVTAGVAAIVYALSTAEASGWLSAQTLGVIAAGIVALAVFAWVETRASEPVIPPHILRLRPVVVANSANLLLMGSYVGVIYVLTLFLQDVAGFSPLKTGLTFAAAGVAGFCGGIAGGKVVGRAGVRIAIVASATLQAAATLALVTLPHNHTMVLVAVGTLVLNFADVVAIVSITIAATTAIPVADQGLASGLVTASQQVGAALGLAVVAAVVAGQTGSATAPGAALLLHGYRWGLITASIIAILSALIALVAMTSPSRPAAAGPAVAEPAAAEPAVQVPQG
jgi:EmrB/QacA subfamily drug resistance transporter